MPVSRINHRIHDVKLHFITNKHTRVLLFVCFFTIGRRRYSAKDTHRRIRASCMADCLCAGFSENRERPRSRKLNSPPPKVVLWGFPASISLIGTATLPRSRAKVKPRAGAVRHRHGSAPHRCTFSQSRSPRSSLCPLPYSALSMYCVGVCWDVLMFPLF